MLVPAPIKRAAEARATKASRREYSTRSCPPSSRQKFTIKVFIFVYRLSWAYDEAAAELALLKRVLVWLQMPWMLPPAPINKAAEASATKDRIRLYSTRSW